MKWVCWRWTTSGRWARRKLVRCCEYSDLSREVRVKKSKWSVSVKTKYWSGSPLTELNGVPGWATRLRATFEPILASSTGSTPGVSRIAS